MQNRYGMPVLVVKFGGTSVANQERIQNAAERIRLEVRKGYKVVAVVSAMADKTNELVDLVGKASVFHDAREYDAVVATGEIVSSGLLAIALQNIGVPARSWQGWQVPIRTSSVHGAARIRDIETSGILARFGDGMDVAVVAGFQGVSRDNRTTTLGRGGSDITAVALAAALNSERCDIYTDVEGVFTADPRIAPRAVMLTRISYEEMLELASMGAKVLQTRSVELAMKYKVKLRVRSSFADLPGTLVCDEEEIMEQNVVSGIAQSKDEAKITILSLADRPGIAAGIFGPLSDANVNIDMIVQNVSEQGRTDITFSLPIEQVDAAEATLAGIRDNGTVHFRNFLTDRNVCKVSVVGIGMRSHAGVASRMFKALASEGINIEVISTSEIKISVLIERKYMELAIQTLHDAFGLHKGG